MNVHARVSREWGIGRRGQRGGGRQGVRPASARTGTNMNRSRRPPRIGRTSTGWRGLAASMRITKTGPRRGLGSRWTLARLLPLPSLRRTGFVAAVCLFRRQQSAMERPGGCICRCKHSAIPFQGRCVHADFATFTGTACTYPPSNGYTIGAPSRLDRAEIAAELRRAEARPSGRASVCLIGSKSETLRLFAPQSTRLFPSPRWMVHTERSHLAVSTLSAGLRQHQISCPAASRTHSFNVRHDRGSLWMHVCMAVVSL